MNFWASEKNWPTSILIYLDIPPPKFMYETSFPLWTTVQLFSDKYSYILLHYWQVDKTKDFLINPQIYQTLAWSHFLGTVLQSTDVIKEIFFGIGQSYTLWQYGLWSFQTGGTKLERFLPKNQHTKRKLLNFKNWVNGEVSKSAKIWHSKSIFYAKNHWNLSNFFSLKNINLEAHFLLLTFFDIF